MDGTRTRCSASSQVEHLNRPLEGDGCKPFTPNLYEASIAEHLGHTAGKRGRSVEDTARSFPWRVGGLMVVEPLCERAVVAEAGIFWVDETTAYLERIAADQGRSMAEVATWIITVDLRRERTIDVELVARPGTTS